MLDPHPQPGCWPSGSFSGLGFPIYKVTLIIFLSHDAANIHFCFKGALGPLDEIHSIATISFFELLCHSILCCYSICSSLYCKIFPWALLKYRCVCDGISSSYLSAPLNFHGLCMSGDYFSAFLCSELQRWKLSIFQGFAMSWSHVLLQSWR